MSTTPEDIAAGFTAESVINEMLDLDELLATEVRRAEKLFPLYTKPHLEAEIDRLVLELQGVSDGSAAKPSEEAAVGEAPEQSERSTEVISAEIQAKRQEYAASRRMIRLRQLPSERWLAWEEQWKDALDKGPSYPPEMWDSLISACAIEPEIPAEKVKALRSQLGYPPLAALAEVAWKLNTEGGVSIPFSQPSSRARLPR